MTFTFAPPTGPPAEAPVPAPSPTYFDADAAANAAYWSGQAAAAKAQEEGRKRLLALRGQNVRVVRGRKVPLGTEGRCFFSGEGKWGWRVGFETPEGETFWTDARNVEAVEGEA